jgi:hypothetical protein
MTEPPALDPDLLTMRRAVAQVVQLNDPLIWETLGLPLAQTLAQMEGSLLSGQPVEIPEAQRYVAENIDAAIVSFRLIKELHSA